MEHAVPDPRKINPLWVICLFLAFIEYIFYKIVLNITGESQIYLITFCIIFAFISIAGFFLLLWYRPANLYPPSEYRSDKGFQDSVSKNNSVNTNTNSSELLPSIEQIVRNILVSQEIVDGISAKKPADIHNVLNDAADSISDKIKEKNFITVLIPDPGKNPSVSEVTYPISAIRDFEDLTNQVYFDIKKNALTKNLLNPYKYGKEWILQDKGTKKVFEHARMLIGFDVDGPVNDKRSLDELGIKSGMILEVILLLRST
jgi:hypothetical protein